MNEVKIRYATNDDINFIVDSQINMAMETEKLVLNKEVVQKGVKAVFNDSLKGFYIIGEVNNTPCSCLMITPEWSDWRNNWVWWIQSVFVLPDMRQSGIFGMMYAFIKSNVIENSEVAGIRLYVDNTNLKARKVYENVGMSDEHYRLFEWMK